MPIYDYKCSICEHEFEKYMPITKAKVGVKCPECKGKSVKVLTGFKGRAHDDNPVWLDKSVRDVLGENVQTRTDYKRCLKENHLIPIG